MANYELAFRKGEKVYYKGSKRASWTSMYIPPQETVIMATFEGGFHLPYKVELKWEDGSVHTHYVEARMLDRGKE